MKKPAPVPFTGYQKTVVAMLAFLQFAVILDFMLMSPLGAVIMPALKIGPAQFGLVVSAYAFSAGAAGLLTAGFADRFDRKQLLLFFYAGFILGTLWCGLAQSFESLLAARIVTGLFGGVIGSVVLAISTDLFPPQMRGRVMGLIQTAFAASQVLGIPAGIYLSNQWNWHIPFIAMAVFGLGRRPAGGVEDAAGERAPGQAAGAHRVDAPVPHADGKALPAGVRHHRPADHRRLHADAVQQRLRGQQPGHRPAAPAHGLPGDRPGDHLHRADDRQSGRRDRQVQGVPVLAPRCRSPWC